MELTRPSRSSCVFLSSFLVFCGREVDQLVRNKRSEIGARYGPRVLLPNVVIPAPGSVLFARIAQPSNQPASTCRCVGQKDIFGSSHALFSGLPQVLLTCVELLL